MSGSVGMKSGRFLTSLAIVILAVATVMAQTGRPGGGNAATATATERTTTSAATTATTVQQSLEEILEEPQGAETYRYDPQGPRDLFIRQPVTQETKNLLLSWGKRIT